MAYLYMAVPPQGSTAAPVTGVYLRMGTFVDDTTNPVDEAGHMPTSFTGGASASEGIFITSAGTYIVTALDEGHIEVQGGVTETVTGADGAMTTTVDEGEVSITIDNGAFNLTGKSSFEVTSESADISISAKKGKVSTTGDYVFNHTYGTYIKMNLGGKNTSVIGPDTNVSVSLNMSFYGSLLLTFKLMTIGFKLVSCTVTLLVMNVGLFSIDYNWQNSMTVSEDAKYAYFYIKYFGMKLESVSANVKWTGAINKTTKAVWLHQAVSKASWTNIASVFGLNSKIPGA
jgi:hypothetical protein